MGLKGFPLGAKDTPVYSVHSRPRANNRPGHQEAGPKAANKVDEGVSGAGKAPGVGN